VSKFRKKPVVVDAILWRGNLVDAEALGSYQGAIIQHFTEDAIDIETLEGTMRCEVGDYLIRGIKGELYPCKADIFEASYEAIE
jgi:hypothetical protein